MNDLKQHNSMVGEISNGDKRCKIYLIINLLNFQISGSDPV